MSAFQMHQQLAADTFAVASLELCEVLLMNDSRYPWLILVPRLPELRELHDVPQSARTTLFDEIDLASRVLQQQFKPFKLNVGALGNVVPQLHIHVIARQPQDPAWPNPVWGNGTAVPYADTAADQLLDDLRSAFG